LLCAASLVGCGGSIVNSLPKKPARTATTTTTSATPTACETDGNLISACKRLGDFSTLDPCSLISVGQLPPDLIASPTSRDSLDDCAFRITAGADKSAQLEVGELATTGDPGAAHYDGGAQALQPAGLSLEEGTLAQGQCDDAVYFSGDLVDLEINVFASNGSGDQALCDAANEVGKAVGTVLAGNVQMQHFTVPKNSLAYVKACGLLNGSQIAGNAMDTEPETPSGHSCFWLPDLNNLDVEYGVDLEIGDAVDSQAADSHTQVAGLDTYTLKYSDTSYSRCEVDTYRLPWGSGSSDLHEIASIWALDSPGKIDEACTAATQMAAIVWPKLPSMS
jgi:hypothetical protein